jgi:multiple sugar transport system ATP-binding protein
MATVSFDNVSKVYPGGVRAVQGLSLSVRDGEFLVLVGPSGCGKTTVLRMLAGLEEVTSGSVAIDGRIVNDVAPKDRDIAMVFQNYALYPHMTVFQNMSFALKRRRMARSEIERRVKETAQTLGILDILGRRPGVLSGGQRQRVAVGRAIVREPRAFLFDEPLSNLDARLRLSTRAELKALHQRLRTTSLYVTHDQEEAMTLGDRIAVMSRGEVQQVDTPLNVYRRPANRFVAEFLGVPPMNLIEGTLELSGESLNFEGRPAADGARVWMRVSQSHEAVLRAHVGRPVVLGLRPQSLREGTGNGSWRVPVSVVEPLGESMDVCCSIGGAILVARVPARSGIAPGSVIELMPESGAAHYFELGEFGRSLLG